MEPDEGGGIFYGAESRPLESNLHSSIRSLKHLLRLCNATERRLFIFGLDDKSLDALSERVASGYSRGACMRARQLAQ